MSTSEIENNIPSANISHGLNFGKKVHKSKGTSPPVLSERKTLQTLQVSSDDENKLARITDHFKQKEMKKETKILVTSKPVQVYKDPVPPTGKTSPKESPKHSPGDSTECECRCHNKSEEEKIIDFMTEEPSANDWRNIAEERRNALAETLVENQQLHFEVSDYKSQVLNLTQEVKELHEETRRLSQQRDYFANILQNLVNDEIDSLSSSDDTPKSTTSDTDEQGSESAFLSDDSSP